MDGDQLLDLNNWEVAAYMDPGTLPEKDVFYWITLDISDNPINFPAGTTFYMVAVCEDYSYGDDNWGSWGTSFELGDTYPGGSNHVYNFNEEVWDVKPYDMVFRTYTTPNGNGNGGPPQITITSSYQIAAVKLLGSFSFLGAVISGTKYFSLVV